MGILAYDSRKKYFDGVGAEIDTTNLEEVYKLAGLDYVVEKHPLFYEDGTPAEGCYGTRALMPNGDVVTMGHVGEQYTVLNNFEAFDFLRDVVGDGVAKEEVILRNVCRILSYRFYRNVIDVVTVYEEHSPRNIVNSQYQVYQGSLTRSCFTYNTYVFTCIYLE